MPIVFIDGVAFKHSLPENELADALAHVAVARAVTNHHVKQLAAGLTKGDAALLEQHHHGLIEGPHARLASAIAANKNLKPAKLQSLERCLAIPGLLNFDLPLSEPVPVYAKPKKSGGVRMIHNPGLLHRTAQDMIARVLSAHYVPRPFQFTHDGVHKAIKAAKSALTSGHVHVARLDVQDFYPSFTIEKLVTELPLRKEVVEHVVVGRLMKVVMDQEHMKAGYASPSLPHTHADLLLLARQGIPQGSACSPIIGAFIMSRLKWSAASDVTLINYVDDFLLMSKSLPLLDLAVGKLTAAVADLPGGQFTLKIKGTGSAEKGFEFLGHHIQVVDAIVNTRPTNVAVHEMFEELGGIEAKLSQMVYVPGKAFKYDKAVATKLVAHMVAKLNGWQAAFCECDTPMRDLEFWVHEISDWLRKLAIPLQEVLDAVEPHMGYRWDGYAIRASVQGGAPWLVGQHKGANNSDAA